MQMEEFVYALECSDKKYFIGRTNDIVKLFSSTRKGFTQWTNRYPAKNIQELFLQKENDCYEISLVLKYMLEQGKDNVRGGPFSKEELEPIQHTMFSLLSKELPMEEPRVIAVYQCEEEKFFVDSWPLSDLPSRFNKHFKGEANTPFTARFKALSIVEMQMDSPMEFHHLRLTLKYMKLYGMNNVRGSVFSSGEVEHSVTETTFIKRLLNIYDGIYDDEDNLIETFD
jgi:predicted GIY-YIG superfamily endonuclease